MYELNEVELASVVGGADISISRSRDVAVVSGNTTVTFKKTEVENSSNVGSGNGAIITITN